MNKEKILIVDDEVGLIKLLEGKILTYNLLCERKGHPFKSSS